MKKRPGRLAKTQNKYMFLYGGEQSRVKPIKVETWWNKEEVVGSGSWSWAVAVAGCLVAEIVHYNEIM